MLFTSLEFLFIFLPVVLAVYFFLPRMFRNYWLLLASLFFYGWGEPKFLIVMVMSIVFNYLLALRIAEYPRGSGPARLFLALDVAGNLAVLFVYKYMNFATGVLHQLLPQTRGVIPQTSFILPIGISFFTFQAMSYVIDVYRGARAQKNPACVGLYISLFPQLIAGPIVRYTTIESEISQRSISMDSFSEGVYRFLCGLNKKILLANVLGAVADKAFGAAEPSVAMAWLGAVCYTLQIYFDFSGYSDMAIGLGRMLGFHFLENFNYPYISRSLTEFWRRWHISLSSWFRDYLYFPLGGSRVNSRRRLVFNLLVVWLATGIWHGANWTFIAWGLMHGALIIMEKLLGLPAKLEKKGGPAAWGYMAFTLLMVTLGWVLFRADSISAAGAYLKTMFGLGNAVLIDGLAIRNFQDHALILILACLCSTPVFKTAYRRFCLKGRGAAAVCGAASCLTQLVLFVISISQLVMNAHNPFIYFNF